MRRTKAWWAIAPVMMFASPVFAGRLNVSPFVAYGVAHDNNLFDETDTEKRADTIRHATLGAHADWPVSRQRFVVTAQASRFRYNHFNELDHSEYDGRAAWRFVLGPAVTGTASYDQERELENFANRGSRQPDFVRQREPRIESYLAITPEWKAHTRLSYLQVQHSLGSEQRFDRHEQQGMAELQYARRPQWLIGAGTEVIDGTFPNRGPSDPLSRKFLQNTPFVRLDWTYSGISRIRGRLGYTIRDNSGGSDRDFSGITGNLEYIRTVSAKTRLAFQLTRQIYSADDVDANYVRDRAAEVRLAWTYSPKLDLTAHIARRRQAYQALFGADSRRDTVNEFMAELTYKPYRTVAVILNASVNHRESNFPGESYDDRIGGLSIRLSLDPEPQ